MIDFNLSTNFIDDPDALLKRTKAKLKRVPALESEDNRIRLNLKPWLTRVFVNSLLQQHRTRPEVNIGDNGFELKSTLINMVQAS
jgi:hypothetical protein